MSKADAMQAVVSMVPRGAPPGKLWAVPGDNPIGLAISREYALDHGLPNPKQYPSWLNYPADRGLPEAAASPTLVDAPLPLDPTYYPAREVDEHPALVSQVRPAYPAKAVKAEVKGDVLVLFMLNENGSVDEVSVLEENPPGYGFDAAVNEWLKQARFKPAMRKGRAVKSRVVYRVTFEP